MKISTNFVNPAQRTVMPVAVSIWVAALLLAAGAIWLIGNASELRGDLPQLRKRLERALEQKNAGAAKTTTSSPVQLPLARELAETRARVAKINAVAQTKGMPTLALLADLERQLPVQAWLTSFHHRASEGEVQLVAAAANAEPLSAFLLKLESDPLFEEVLLMREVQPAGGRPNVQFEIRLKVRP